MSDSVLEIEGLAVGYHAYGARPVMALQNIDLSIGRGEVVGLVGESGAGKTTLARAIMGMVPAPGRIESGSIRFGDRELTKTPRETFRTLRGRDLAMIVPNPRGELNPLVRIGRQLANVVRVHQGLADRAAKQAALAMLEAVSIPDPDRRYRAYPHELSGGMAQRVVIAIALICSPKFVISDDATSGLDVTVQAQILDLLRQLVRDHELSMLYITRDLGVAAHFCDRIAILYEGQIVEVANKDTIFEDPKHPYTNTLMAAFSQNPKLRANWQVDGPSRFSEPARAGSSCPYVARCVKARSRCAEEYPLLRDVRRSHQVRCHFPVER